VTVEGAQGVWTGAGPGPAAASKIGAATRNALSGIVEAGGELDTGDETADSRPAAVPSLVSRAADEHALSDPSAATSATSPIFTML
jgi:hypothetical protein